MERKGLKNYFLNTHQATHKLLAMLPAALKAPSKSDESPKVTLKNDSRNTHNALKTGALATLLTITTLAPTQKTFAQDTTQDYTTTITVRDEKSNVNGQGAYFVSGLDEIRIKKSDINWSDFGFDKAPQDAPQELTLVHERQHQINEQKGVRSAIVSLDENYQRDVHDEVTALIAEKLEIRKQYKDCQTDEELQAFFNKFAKLPEHADYLYALRTKEINPNSTSPDDFKKEMAFIKDSSIRYRADPSDDAYKRSWMRNTKIYLQQNPAEIKSNPNALKKAVHDMYVIGGFDFNTVGNQDIHLIENQAVQTADNFLAQGGNPKKILRFLDQGDSSYKLAETFDLTGLNREQAQKVIQTAFISEYLSQNIAGDLVLGLKPSYDFNYISGSQRNQVATYLDIKEDIWEKNGTLSEKGDEHKFEDMMKQAKQVTLDAKGWYEAFQNNIRSKKFTADEIYDRVQEFHGKTINFDETVSNADDLKLPLDGTSKDKILDALTQKENKQKEISEQYAKDHPNETVLSDTYVVSITDFQSSLLKDELEKLEEEQRKLAETLEPLYPQKNLKTYAPLSDGMMVQIKNPEFDTAELKITTNDADGTSTEVTLLDGQKHGAEITRDSEGNITDYKIYNHGEEIDLSKHTVELKTETKDGINATSITLDGQKFGAEIVSDTSGKTKVAFYEQGGALIQGTQTSSYTKNQEHINVANLTLKDELLAQEGSLPENPQAEAQNMRYDMHWGKRSTPDNSMGIMKKTSPEKQNTTEPIKPLWQKDITH